MQKPSKDFIIGAYNDLIAKNDGRVIGEDIFTRATRLSRYHWHGGYWQRWSAFQLAAGHTPNQPTQKIADGILLHRLAELALELENIPIQADLIRKRKEDSTFPDKACFNRWGNREALLAKLADYCEGKEQFAPVANLLKNSLSRDLDLRLDSLRISGFVYLLRSGKRYKLGRTNATGRRLRELAIQLPEKPNTIHVIETDDPEGIEHYWHQRFEDKRQGGEWFNLTSADVKAFKKRRFQ